MGSAEGWVAWGSTCLAIGAVLQTALYVAERTDRAPRFRSRFWAWGWSVICVGAVMAAVGSWRLL